MASGCCGGGVVATPTPPDSPMAMAIQAGVYQMNGNDYVLVQLNDGNTGDHGIKGLVTKIDYHYRVSGDRFLMHVDDVPAHTNPRITNMRVLVVQEEPSYVGEAELEIEPPQPEETKEEMQPEKPSLEMVDGLPSITNLESISAKQQAALEGMGMLSVKDILSLGVEGLITVKGIGPATADTIMKEAAQILSSM